ncbi:S-adenosyl-L-methionine-dependent methyltransferase [Emericellopsis atlantica]|uniref:Arsenite methyltransferase n=1 Tax=Emericellopsis atlantica TaxID=2614577 RepID=A0A9P7ZCW5_9HYPO|nr:S-adenosyl-L-methionine-dependent methyltransferase [Emericellopsis atlantica]KAG9249685.1 S-adenosyl-L-methionine-dependent methyltransferase [Emericellopsis atlantica]
MESKEIYDQVNKRYGSVTQSTTGKYEQTIAEAFGYRAEELATIPQDANLGLSCGNPLALAKLTEGETVIDFGSGAGFDVFPAAKRVGPTGKAIGIDMNKNMIDRANANAAKMGSTNAQFIESVITSVPLPDTTADCIISNCVINLVPVGEKQQAFNEMFRLLKPGGRVAISDILARKKFTTEIENNVALYVGCVAGASQAVEYEKFLKNASFSDVLIVDTKSDLNVYVTALEGEASCCGPSPKVNIKSCCEPESDSSAEACQKQATSMPTDAETLVTQLGIKDLNEWAGSFQVYAIKPLRV